MTAADEDARRLDILDAAGAIFMEKGFSAATTLEIARRARISKRDLYRHFPTKQAILEALILTTTESTMVLPEALAAPKDRTAFLDTLRDYGALFLKAYFDPMVVSMYRLAIAEAPRSTDLGRALLEKGAGPVTASIRPFAAHAIAAGILPAEDADLILGTCFDVLMGELQIELLLGCRAAPDETECAARAERAVKVVARLLPG